MQCQALLSEGGGNTVSVLVNGQVRPVVLDKPPAWLPGQVSDQAFKSQPQPVLAIDEAGDFDKDQAFSYGAWVKFTKPIGSGSVVARMDDQHDYRGWDLWVQGGRPAAHIVHKWPGDALKVVGKMPLQARIYYFTSRPCKARKKIYRHD